MVKCPNCGFTAQVRENIPLLMIMDIMLMQNMFAVAVSILIPRTILKIFLKKMQTY